MRPLYEQLKRNHYSSIETQPGYLPSDAVFSEIGYNFKQMVASNEAYKNTCAVRMSLALLKSNIDFDGRFTIKDGLYKGRKFETGAKLLADQLYKASVFGKAEVYTDIRVAGQKLRNRRGVVYFHNIVGYGGGHIDIIEPLHDNMFLCNSGCFTNCKEVWFWELN
jgi:hypothetical protein